jgi:general secretion pathway protein D
MAPGANTPPGSNRAGGMLAGQSGNRSTDPAGGMGGSGGQGVNPTLQNVRITADVTNNTVLVYANMENQRIVEQTIRQIDRPQRQVAIEATIAEVTLNDNLTYGVQFFLSSKDLGLKADKGSIVNTIGTAALNRVLPGFNLLVGPEAQPKMVLDALHNITDVKVLSNPSLVVLDNQVATLQVGDQVPISTGSATVLTTNNTIVNTIDYRNTGIILRILPRSNANGNVVLDIEQEISNVPDTTTLTPTISQRRVKSSIAVNSGQTVLLAGLISDQENKTRNGIPGLDKLPGAIGDAFSHQTIAKKRIELILLIRPTVIRDPVDAHVLAEELRSKMNGRLVGSTLPVPTLDAPNIRRQ